MMRDYDIVIVGAGPAGLAAAHAAASSGARIAVVDDNPFAGGQIWRGGPQHAQDQRAPRLWSALQQCRNVDFLQRTRVGAAPDERTLLAETPDGALALRFGKLIIATGARERLLPFPGWTLPGVTGAGGLQALVKGGFPVAGKRVVVAGSGPLLLAVAATLREKGAVVVAILEQAPLRKLAGFGLSLGLTPSKLTQALALRRALAGIPYLFDAWVTAAEGDGTVRQASYRHGGTVRKIACDLLACGYGLVPNTELAGMLGCRLRDRTVDVDAMQQTSVPGIYCAGEGTGIGGVDLSLAEGRIAGLAASGQGEAARADMAARERWRGFARRLARTFALRDELRMLSSADTLVCRCEDVRYGDLATHGSWRSAKLHTRCGMGACQGRICGGATEILFGWTQDSVRLPLAPMRIGSLVTGGAAAAGEGCAISDASAARDTRSA